MGGDIKGSREYRSNCAVLGRGVQVRGTVSVTIWKQYLDVEKGDTRGPDSIPTSVGATNHGGDGETWRRGIVGISRGRGGDGLCGAPPHRSIHKKAADSQSREGGLTACLCIVQRGREGAGDDPYGALVGSRQGK